jgi:hypothetical protein
MKASYSKSAPKEIDRLRDPLATKGLVKALDLPTLSTYLKT